MAPEETQHHFGQKGESPLAASQGFWWILGCFRALLYVRPCLACTGGIVTDFLRFCFSADSLRYLNLSEATVITFMMPLVASFGGYMFLGSTISWLEILLSIISLFGVLLVASPGAIFTTDLNDSEPGDPGSVDASSSSRVWAICIGLLGVCGSAAAFLCMSYIGKAESPLTVVNYFAALCTLASFIALILLPGLGFQAPVDMWEWGLLFFSGLSGFFMVSATFTRPSFSSLD